MCRSSGKKAGGSPADYCNSFITHIHSLKFSLIYNTIFFLKNQLFETLLLKIKHNCGIIIKKFGEVRMNNTPQKKQMHTGNVNAKNNRIREMKRRKRLRKRFFIIFLIVYVVLLLATLIVFSLTLKSCEKREKKHDVVINSGEDETYMLNDSELYFDGEFYLPISAIEKLTTIKISGDKNELSFILECNGEYAKFEIGTTSAYINGNHVMLNNNSIMVNGELYLPFDFFVNNMTGFSISLDEKKKKYSISSEAGKEPAFILKAPTQTTPLKESERLEETESPMNFVLDLSSYEIYMNPEDRDEYLLLVNTDNPLDESYAPTDLTGSVYTRSDRDTRTLRKYACLALEAFLKEGEANGVKGVTVTSAYRSYDYQNQLFRNEVALLGSEEEAAKNVNPPGSSEHQTGLAVDMHNMSAASREFGKTDEAKWLAQNAHKFGYILRYPADKTDITGISYEPWHFRFVGRYHATKMFELDMCLEEYIEYIKQ